MRKPTCLCGKCPTCLQRAANHRWKAKYPEKAKAMQDMYNQQRSAAREAARLSTPVVAPRRSHKGLDEMALKWLQDKGFR